MPVNVSIDKSPRILIIRRDNIGDLVCTTPLIRALRQKLPGAWIGALVNSYNAPVLVGNPDLDAVFHYTKAKHRGHKTLPHIFWQRLLMMKTLRGMHLDDILLATPVSQPRSIRLAQWLRPKQIIGFGERHEGLDIALPLAEHEISEVADVFRLASLYGIEGSPPPCFVAPPKDANKRHDFTIAVHISARKPSQRWPTERFIELMSLLQKQQNARFVLLWSPGPADNPLHPGDDEKALAMVEALGPSFPVNAVPTHKLSQLINVLSSCHAMICADGGAMHLAAGLGLPMVCLFGKSGAVRWHPWGVPYQLLQKPSQEVADIAVEEVVEAFGKLALCGL
ncbi:MAG: glycosyltransferase family 9 protein [Rhodocyclaceae bacterium]|nr:glycosyltransferase family 9 protein [Rhodocyclaceae bacterium]